MAVGLLLLAACSTAEVEPGPITSFDDIVEPGPVTSFEDIAGTTYERVSPGAVWFMHIFEDGTWHRSSNRDLVEDRPSDIMETRFEGTKVFVTETKGRCDEDEADFFAIYEIHLLENGNVEVAAIEDTCGSRPGYLSGEWAPVP
jgi:hypothetical protein